MKGIERRRLDMFIRVREYVQSMLAQFGPTSFVAQLLATLVGVINQLETHTSAQVSNRSAAQEGTLSKSAAYDELLRALQAICRTARAIALTKPTIIEKFRMPYGLSDQEFLAAARAIAANAQPLEAEFIKRGHPPDFLADLQEDIDQMEEAIARRAQSSTAQVESTAAIDDLMDEGMNAVRELDPIMRNTYANDPVKLAGWISASHVERTSRRTQTQTAQPATQPTPTTT